MTKEIKNHIQNLKDEGVKINDNQIDNIIGKILGIEEINDKNL